MSEHSQRFPRVASMWGLYNYGRLWSVHGKRRDAMQAAEQSIGVPWKKCREYMEVHRVAVSPRQPPHVGARQDE